MNDIVSKFIQSRPEFWGVMTSREKWNYVAKEQKIRRKLEKSQKLRVARSNMPRPKRIVVTRAAVAFSPPSGYYEIEDLLLKCSTTRPSTKRGCKLGKIRKYKIGRRVAYNGDDTIKYVAECKEARRVSALHMLQVKRDKRTACAILRTS
jgi:hypothetical protein